MKITRTRLTTIATICFMCQKEKKYLKETKLWSVTCNHECYSEYVCEDCLKNSKDGLMSKLCWGDPFTYRIMKVIDENK